MDKHDHLRDHVETLNSIHARKCDQPLIEELEALLRAAENAALPEKKSMNPAQINRSIRASTDHAEHNLNTKKTL